MLVILRPTVLLWISLVVKSASLGLVDVPNGKTSLRHDAGLERLAILDQEEFARWVSAFAISNLVHVGTDLACLHGVHAWPRRLGGNPIEQHLRKGAWVRRVQLVAVKSPTVSHQTVAADSVTVVAVVVQVSETHEMAQFMGNRSNVRHLTTTGTPKSWRNVIILNGDAIGCHPIVVELPVVRPDAVRILCAVFGGVSRVDDGKSVNPSIVVGIEFLKRLAVVDVESQNFHDGLVHDVGSAVSAVGVVGLVAHDGHPVPDRGFDGELVVGILFVKVAHRSGRCASRIGLASREIEEDVVIVHRWQIAVLVIVETN
mmetsp:Transcript_9540/g.27193  ORF Transcript_9540/g.27193 Transcript_9540/m.27193 type:complete len:315 (+) Transcript_9540:1738-2682(+)